MVYWDLDSMMMLFALIELIPGLAGGIVTFFQLGGLLLSIVMVSLSLILLWLELGWFFQGIIIFVDCY